MSEDSKTADLIPGHYGEEVDFEQSSELREQGADEIEAIIAQLELIANADPRKLYGEDGRQLAPGKWDDATAMAVTRITPNAHGLVVQFADKGRALDQLARIKGAFKPAEERKSPLEELFEAVPREDRKLILSQLKALTRIEKQKRRDETDVEQSDTLLEAAQEDPDTISDLGEDEDAVF